MLSAGKPAVKVLGDGWTAVTKDGSLAAHFEHTVAVTAGEPWILTARSAAGAGAGRDLVDPSAGTGSSRAKARDERPRAGMAPPHREGMPGTKCPLGGRTESAASP